MKANRTKRKQLKLAGDKPPIVWADIERNRAAMSIEELASVSGFSRATIYNHAKEGKLKITKIVGRAIITVPDAKAYLGL